MKRSSILKMTGVLAAFGLASALFAAAPPTVADSAGNLTQKASGLLAEIHQNAQAVQRSADTLEGYNREALLLDWHADADKLDRMRGRINTIDQTVRQLRTMEMDLPHAQRSEINQIAPAAAELTDNAQLAINYLKTNQDRTMFAPYTSYANEMYSEAARIVHSTATAEGRS